MEIDPQYTFTPLAEKSDEEINDRTTQELFAKWGLKGNISIQNFLFNEPFQPYHKYHLTETFFKNEVIAEELKTKQNNSWVKQGIIASTVEVKQVPCSVLSMSFFDKLKDPKNRIIHNSGTICKRYDLDVNGFLVSDNLRGMLLDEECNEYNLYTKNEREEFIFRIFQMLILGGSLCQYEDTVEPYLNITKKLYKDLIRVQKRENTNDLSISTMVLEVVVKDSCNRAYFPYDPSNIQNVGFLLINGSCRQITTFLHQFG